MKKTIQTFLDAKREGRKLSELTAYDYSMAKIIDGAGVDAILVGDSLGMVVLGYENTLAVTMEDMIHHTRAVCRGVSEALLITDMPFMSYQASVYDAVVNAGRLVREGGAHAVKIEGGADFAEHIRAVTRASIPVQGHIGLTPQSVHALGGFKVQGKSEVAARKLIEDAKAVAAAGAFSIVLECVPAKLAAIVSRELSIPTIGIGAGRECDGQVLVFADMLGLFPDFTPKFVKRFADLGPVMQQAIVDYAREVREGTFPGEEHGFNISDDVLQKLY